MKKILLISLLFTACAVGRAQDRFLTRTGHIRFFSSAPLENIQADNNQVTAVLDVVKGDIAFKVVMKSFEFQKAAMQDHFNTQYLHTDKYPNAEFEGRVTNLGAIDFKKDGTYPVQVAGKLTLHGVTNDIKQAGTVVVKGGNVSTNAKFNLALADYNVKIPSDFTKKIAETVEVTVDCTLAPYTR